MFKRHLAIFRASPNLGGLPGSSHELGHLFDEGGDDKWVFASEATASYKAWLAIEKCGGKIYEDGNYVEALQYHWNKNLYEHTSNDYDHNPANPYKYRIFLDNGDYADRDWRYGDDIVFILNPIINQLDWRPAGVF